MKLIFCMQISITVSCKLISPLGKSVDIVVISVVIIISVVVIVVVISDSHDQALSKYSM